MNASTPDPRFGSWLNEHAPRAADDLLDRTMGRVRAARPRRASHRRPTPRFAALVAAFMVVVASSAGLLLNLPSTHVGPPPSASGNPVSATTANSPPPVQVTASPTAAFPVWTRIDLADPAPTLIGGGTPSDVVAFRAGYVAIGTGLACCGGVPSQNWGVVWTSNDGRTWQLHNHLKSLEGAYLGSLLTDGRSLYALGWYPTPGRTASPAVWVSTDGLDWTRSTGIAPTLAAVGPSGLVGVIAGTNQTFRFLESSDGLVWSYTSAAYHAFVTAIAAAPDGSAIALGSTEPIDDLLIASGDILEWHSQDGSWTGPVRVGTRGIPTSVTRAGEGFLTIVLRSPTGLPGSRTEVWHLVGEAPPVVIPVPLGNDRLRSVFAFGSTVVLTGITCCGRTESTSSNAMIWVSADGGTTFTRVADEGGFSGYLDEVTGVAEMSNGLLAVGRLGDGLTVHAVPEVWISTR